MSNTQQLAEKHRRRLCLWATIAGLLGALSLSVLVSLIPGRLGAALHGILNRRGVMVHGILFLLIRNCTLYIYLHRKVLGREVLVYFRDHSLMPFALGVVGWMMGAASALSGLGEFTAEQGVTPDALGTVVARMFIAGAVSTDPLILGVLASLVSCWLYFELRTRVASC